ncbi:nucleolar protein 58-like isoform X1 [Papilio machaon]|uniref:nucleolar protein 58-like isoform X1 n=2 Tax=Papilio machaon TaxID=76193 RepID=UPI001E664837|nr:nucleolar protein 58-like isoform X1 [Papilio machaon]
MFFSSTMQPNFFYGAGPQNTVPYTHFQPPVQSNVQSPEIIGEGDVTSVVLPNGSVQYFFIPTIKRDVWTPCAYTPPTMNVNWNIPSQAWFIRNISNPITPSFCSGQQYLRPYAEPFIANIMPTDCNTNTPALGYTNMFHYDRCTSTSDLQYFYPRVLSRHQQTTDVKVKSLRKPICLFDLACDKPCPCGVVSGTKYYQDESEKEPEHVSSAMSIEGVERKVSCECPPKDKSLGKSVITLRDSSFEEDSEEITVAEKNKIHESSKMKSLEKEKNNSTSKSKAKNFKIGRKPSPVEINIKDTPSQRDSKNLRKSRYYKLEKSEESSSSEKEKVGTDELKLKKQVKDEKEKKKREKCQCEEDSDSDSKPAEKEEKRSCCCTRKRYKGVASYKDKEKAENQLSLIEIVGHCDGSCCCSQCAANGAPQPQTKSRK